MFRIKLFLNCIVRGISYAYIQIPNILCMGKLLDRYKEDIFILI